MTEVAASVVIPTYNDPPDGLRWAVASVMRSSVPVECIVVDDGSESSVAWIRQEFPRLRILRHDENRGRGAARQTGIDAARSPLVVWQDADDWSRLGRFSQIVEYMARNPAVDVVGTGMIVELGSESMGMRCSTTQPRVLQPGEDPPLAFATTAVRRTVFEHHPFDTSVRIAEDFDWMARALLHHKFASIADPLYVYNTDSSPSLRAYVAAQSVRSHALRTQAMGSPTRFLRAVASPAGRSAVYAAATLVGARPALVRRRYHQISDEAVDAYHRDWELLATWLVERGA